tara:strand:+ start:315 stop:431 length:117 start_codon:yes stop_codon:yes gene_type:complete
MFMYHPQDIDFPKEKFGPLILQMEEALGCASQATQALD